MTDRKYRQQGYQDRGPRTGGGSGGGFVDDRPARLEGAPKGRGSETNREEIFRCKTCGEAAAPDFAADAVCRKCGGALHACAQCRHFDTSARNQCRKAVPAPIPAKTRRNDCALFEPAVSLNLKPKSSIETPDAARAAFDKLFGKK